VTDLKSAVASLQEDTIRFNHRQYQAPMMAAFRPHAHDLWEVLYLPYGNAYCMIEGRRYRLPAHTLIIHRPARIHRIHVEGDTVYEHYSLMCDAPSLIPDGIFTRRVRACPLSKWRRMAWIPPSSATTWPRRS